MKSNIGKRVFDMAFSAIALLVFFLPGILIVLLLVLRERHAVFFKQERIGLIKTQNLNNMLPVLESILAKVKNKKALLPDSEPATGILPLSGCISS